jgi:hypothetical protein
MSATIEDCKLMDVCDSFSGSPTFSDDEVIEAENEILKAFENTPIGDFLARNYETPAWDFVVQQARARHWGDYPGRIFVHRLEAVAQDLIQTKDPRVERYSIWEDVQPEPVRQPTEQEKFAEICNQVRADIGDPMSGNPGAISTAEIKRKRQTNPEYERAFQAVQTDAVQRGFGISQKATDDGEFRFMVNGQEQSRTASELRQLAHIVNENLETRGASCLKPSGGLVTMIASGKSYRYPSQEFCSLLEEITRRGLVR